MADDPLRRVTAVVVTYCSESQVDGLLESLPRDRLAGIYAVDNASTDGTVERLDQAGVSAFANPVNLGFGAGCNIGWSHASSELVLFLNPDARISAKDLETLVSYLDAHPHCALVGPRLHRGPEPLISAGGRAGLRTELRFCLPQRLARRLPDRRLPATYDRSGPVGMVEGACLLVRSAAFLEVGGFDERYFLYFEELDLAERLRRRGHTADLVAEASATHSGGASSQQRRWQARDDYYASTVRFLWRWRGPSRARLYTLLASASWRALARSGGLPKAESAAYRQAVQRTLRLLRADG